MKKFLIILLFILGLCSCGEKEESAEVLLDNGEVLSISRTEDRTEVLRTFEVLKEKKSKPLAVGAKIKLHNDLSGKVLIGKEEPTTVDLSYEIDSEFLFGFKNCLAEGNILLKGKVDTDSNAFSFISDYYIDGSFFNDEAYVYYDVYASMGSTSGNVKQRLDYTEYAGDFKNQARLYFELLNYYNIFELIKSMEEFVDMYSVSITATTKDSFEIKMSIPLDNQKISLYVTLDCQSLFPKSLRFEAQEAIAEELKKKYVDEYLTEEVEVTSAHFYLLLDIEYGDFKVSDKATSIKDSYV